MTTSTQSSNSYKYNLYESGKVSDFTVRQYRKYVLDDIYKYQENYKPVHRIIIDTRTKGFGKILHQNVHFLECKYIDDEESYSTYCIGYSVPILQEIQSSNKTYCPVFYQQTGRNKSYLNAELLDKYKILIKKYRNNFMWDFLISFHVRGVSSGHCIPLEIACIIYSYYVDEW